MSRKAGLAVKTGLAVLMALAGAPCLAAPPEPAEFRQDNFRAPTPDTQSGARVIDSAEAEALWRSGQAVFIDVVPATLGTGVHDGKWLPAQPRQDIPGSLWLPNVGYGTLSPQIEGYFRSNLQRQAQKDGPKGGLVFYCLTDCWMSWNAAKRALAWGQSQVMWFPGGTDGWAERGLPLVEATPVPLAAE